MKTMKKKTGFTLFELLVVISIIALIIAAVTASYSSTQKRARDSRRRQDIDQVHKALEQYYGDNTEYPTASCNPGSTYLPGDLPVDPKDGDDYNYNDWDCDDADQYCICARLEATTTGGNATDVACSWGSGSYYCKQNVQ